MVYVDQLKSWPQAPQPGSERWFGNGKKSCHLFANTEQELHAFAGQLGLKRIWFQVSKGNNRRMDHYDLIPAKRALAKQLGAHEILTKEWIRRTKMREVIILSGLPASGKTTWAFDYLENHPKCVRINRDDLRHMGYVGPWTEQKESIVFRIRHAAVTAALDAGWSVIVDDTNLLPHQVDPIFNIAELMDVPVRIVRMNTSLEECILRDSRRGNPVGEKRIREMYDQWQKADESSRPL